MNPLLSGKAYPMASLEVELRETSERKTLIDFEV